MRKVNLTEEQIKDLKELTSPEIQKKYYWYPEKVRYYRKKYNITDYPLGKKILYLTEEQIQDLSKLNSDQLKDKYGWTSNQLGNYRKRHNVTEYPRLRNQKKNIPSASELSYLTINDVMEKYDICLSTAKNWFQSRGVSYKYRPNETREIIKEKDKEISDLKHQIRNMRMVYAMPFMRDAELARAFNLSRERIRQLRNRYQVSLCFKG